MELIYILTYDCNFRCNYCGIDKRKQDITKEVIEKSLVFLKEANIRIEKVKFFGGEPMLKQDFIKKIILNFHNKDSTTFYSTTNSTLVKEDFIKFSNENNLKLTFSLDGSGNTTAENRKTLSGNNLSELIIKNTKQYSDYIRVNQVITSSNSDRFFENFIFIYNLGVRNFNFLPEYYANWSKKGLLNLQKGFSKIENFYKSGNKFNLVNLENYSETAFYNLGIVIDTDGKIYGTNLILIGIFEKYKEDLIIGDINTGLNYEIDNDNFKLNYISKINTILAKEYSKEVLTSVKYVDLILNDFCKKLIK